MRVSPVLAMASMVGSGVGMFAISWLASRCLSPLELGFLLAFLSFGTFVQLADFGLNYASLLAGGRRAGAEKAGELAALNSFIARMNAGVACASSTVVGLLGTWTFLSGAQGHGATRVHWEWPWAVFLLGIFAIQLGTPALSLREGCGRTSQVWWLRLIQEVAGALACIAALAFGWHLWSAAVYALVRATVINGWLRFGGRIAGAGSAPRFTLRQWAAENWSFQWRVGLSSLAGFLIFRAVTPIIFAFQGPVSGGQYGLALAVMNLLLAVTGAWPTSQTALYASLLAAGKHREFDREVPKTVLRSTALAVLAALAAYAAIRLAKAWGLAFAVRMADPKICAILLASAVAYHTAGCLIVFLRAEGRDPLWILNVGGGIVTVLALWLAATRGSLTAVALTQLGMAVIGVFIVTMFFRAHRKCRATRIFAASER